MSARSGVAGSRPSRPHLGPSQVIFCVGRKNATNCKILLIFLGGPLLLSTFEGVLSPPSGYHALLGSSPSPPQGRPGELPLFLLVAMGPVASPSLVPLPPHIYTKFLRRLGSSLHSFLKKPWHAKAIFWVPGCGPSAAARPRI